MSRLTLVLGASCLVLGSWAAAADEPYRPEAGQFPDLEQAHSYRGELTFVDHANRRGSIRVQSTGIFRCSAPRPFALLPYGIVRYHGAPADLRDVPLGSSGIQIRFETDPITEGLRPTRIVRIRPANWPDVHVPREEYLSDGASSVDERFPAPAIFPKY